MRSIAVLLTAVVLLSCSQSAEQSRASSSSMPDPAMRWDHRPEAEIWTDATLAALRGHGSVLPQTVPSDIDRFCPGYRSASMAERRAFWSGLFSALAKFESTWRPDAAGGGGRWIGLLQIAPATAQGYGCRATSPGQLKNGAANLSCGVRIAAAQVARDEELVGEPGAWRGVARDWAPFRDPDKVADMARWTRAQEYCH